MNSSYLIYSVHTPHLRYPIDLNKRIEYLSRAIANAKSSSGTRSDNSEYLHDLEERIEVAQVQQEVLSNAENSLETETADELNSKLLTISEVSKNVLFV